MDDRGQYMENYTYTDIAWEFLRRNKDYIRDWKNLGRVKSGEEHVKCFLEVRQNENDLLAEKKWGILKFIDPDNSNPSNVFWSPRLSKKSTRIIFSQSGSCSWENIFENTRVQHKKLILHDNSLCIKIFNNHEYFQFFIDAPVQINKRSQFYIYVPLTLNNDCCNKCAAVINGILNNKSKSSAKESRHHKLLATIDSMNKGLSHREIASHLFGEKAVEKEWSSDSWLRAKLRYRIKKANELINFGYYDYL